MTPRHVVLVAAALAVLGLGVYLFLEVRAAPEVVVPPPGRAAPADAPARPPEAATPAAPPPRAAGTPGRAIRVDDVWPGGVDPRPVDPPGDTAAPTLAADAQKVDAIMAEANKAYDRGEFEEAITIAQRVLATDPKNVRMLRIVVSANCIAGDSVEAQRAYLNLPPADRAAMRTRCDRYGVAFTE